MEYDWIIEQPIDLEHKQYLVLDYIKKTEEKLDRFELYPSFQQLTIHYSSMSRVLSDGQFITLKRIPEDIDDEILFNHLNEMYVYQFNINRLTDKTMENKCHIEKIYQGNTTNVMKIIDENNVYGKVNKLSLGELKKEDIKKMPIFEVLISQNFPLEGCLLPLIRRKVMGYLFQTIKLEELKND